MDVFWYILLLSLFLLLVLGALLWKKYSIMQTHHQKKRKKVQSYFESIKNKPISSQKIIEYDIVLGECLRLKGKKGSVGEMMKAYTGFINPNAIWSAHKLRNTIAHELGYTPDIQTLQAAERSYHRELYAMLYP